MNRPPKEEMDWKALEARLIAAHERLKKSEDFEALVTKHLLKLEQTQAGSLERSAALAAYKKFLGAGEK